MFDLWKPAMPIEGLYVWLPLTFDSGKPIIQWYTEWDLSLFEKSNAQ
jgi:hypothetical protein